MNGDAWSSERYDREAQDLYERGEWEGARRLLRQAVLEHPESLELRVSLAYAELACEEYAWARRAFEEVLTADPDHVDALIGLGEALLKIDRARAFATFDRALRLSSEVEAEVTLAIGRALYREGLYERALALFERSLGSRDAADAAAEIAYTLYNLGRAGEAPPYLERALAADPGHHEARVFLGTVLYEGGEFERALETLERVPAAEFWDALALWRTIELLRSIRRVPEDSPLLDPYLLRLSELSVEPTPEERLLAALEIGPEDADDPGQLDLFGMPRQPAHVVYGRDGRVYLGDWEEIVRAMRDDGPDPTMTVQAFMRTAAGIILRTTGIRVPDDSPEDFLRGAERAGVLRIGP
ncbi:MAG: tetratricopeptide repeat protein [Gemmatimonadota bacterium]|nr:MAG: tetratricopeptide repeat protein [Gemmatimonadota bacterium]